MNRKHFLASAGALAAGAFLSKASQAAVQDPGPKSEAFRRPPSLKPGDTIAITSPAGTITVAELTPAVAVLESWGFKVRLGNTIGKKDFTLGGTDAERAADLQALLDDPSVKAIMCARGGYGSVRIVDHLVWDRFRKHPKWVIGFSDITVLLNHIHTVCRTAAIHSKMCNSFPDDWSKAEPIQVETILSIRDALEGRKLSYEAAVNPANRPGTAAGILVGGNLKTIESLAGSATDLTTTGKILFVEDTGEYLYSIDRMFWNLKRSGKLDRLKGLVVGGFKVKPDDPGDEFGRTVQDIVLDRVKTFRYPVCFDFPVGHQRANFALVCGVRHLLSVAADKVTLTQSA
ncbi:MAG: peptidase LD-carboxypeptidase [Flaviaesturariibacter sp.]|nr:peptidase LD-carboxypeptidase [Flaviaesturariibacter sp.]